MDKLRPENQEGMSPIYLDDILTIRDGTPRNEVAEQAIRCYSARHRRRRCAGAPSARGQANYSPAVRHVAQVAVERRCRIRRLSLDLGWRLMPTPRGSQPENTADHAAPRRANGRWAPGSSPNPGGRPKVIADIRHLARQHTTTALQALVEIAENGEHEAARVSAASAILDRAWGKPTTVLAGDGSMPAIAVTTEDKAAELAREQAATQAILDAAFGPEESAVK